MGGGNVEIILKLRDMFSKPVAKVATQTAKASKGIVSGFNRIRDAARRGASGFTNFFQVIQKNWAMVLAFIGSLRALARFTTECVQAANEQVIAEKRLAAALKSHGNAVESTSKLVKDYATALQLQLGIADDVTISIGAQITALTGLSGQALKDAITATIQLANVSKMELEPAGRLIAKTLESDTNALARYGIELTKGADAQTKLAEILLKTKAGWDMAAAEADTFAGKQRILIAQWGDFKEQLGMFITQSPDVGAAYQFISTKLAEFTAYLASPKAQEAWARTIKDAKELAKNIWEIIKACKPLFDVIAGVIKWFGKLDTTSRNLALSIGITSVALLKLATSIGGVTSLKAAITAFGAAGAAAFGVIGLAAAGLITVIVDLKNQISSLFDDIEQEYKNAAAADKKYREAIKNGGYTPPGWNPDKPGAYTAPSLPKGKGSVGGGLSPSVQAFMSYQNPLTDTNLYRRQQSAAMADKPYLPYSTGRSKPYNANAYTSARDIITAISQANYLRYQIRQESLPDQQATLERRLQAEIDVEEATMKVVEAFRKLQAASMDRVEFQRAQNAMYSSTGSSLGTTGQYRDYFKSQEFGMALGTSMQSGDISGMIASLGSGYVSNALSNVSGGILGQAMTGLGLMASPVIGLISSLVGGALGKLFGGKSKLAEAKATPVDVNIVNLKDLTLSILEAGRRERIASGAAGINALVNDVNRQAMRLGYGAQ